MCQEHSSDVRYFQQHYSYPHFASEKRHRKPRSLVRHHARSLDTQEDVHLDGPGPCEVRLPATETRPEVAAAATTTTGARIAFPMLPCGQQGPQAPHTTRTKARVPGPQASGQLSSSQALLSRSQEGLPDPVGEDRMADLLATAFN